MALLEIGRRQILYVMEQRLTLELNRSLDAVKAALRHYPREQITGGHVHGLIQSAAPEINVREIVGIPTGPGALTQFINTYLKDHLERVGNQGGDILYSIVGHAGEAGKAATSPSIWRAFVSPNSSSFLVFKRDEMKIVVRADPPKDVVNEIEIAKAAFAEHDIIRKDFESVLAEGDLQTIHRLNEAHSDFTSWIAALRTEVPAIYKKWGIFRKEKLFELFVSRVEPLELDEDGRLALITQINESQRNSYEASLASKDSVRPTEARPNSQYLATMTKSGSAISIDRARKLAGRAIELMAYDDLRALKIPLGALLDAMHEEI